MMMFGALKRILSRVLCKNGIPGNEIDRKFKFLFDLHNQKTNQKKHQQIW